MEAKAVKNYKNMSLLSVAIVRIYKYDEPVYIFHEIF